MGIEILNSEVHPIAEVVYSNDIKIFKPAKNRNGKDKRLFTVDETITIFMIADSLTSQAYYTPGLLDMFDELFWVHLLLSIDSISYTKDKPIAFKPNSHKSVGIFVRVE